MFNITLQRNVFLSFQEFANTLSWYPLASESARSVVNAWNSLIQEVRLFFLQYLTGVDEKKKREPVHHISKRWEANRETSGEKFEKSASQDM